VQDDEVVAGSVGNMLREVWTDGTGTSTLNRPSRQRWGSGQGPGGDDRGRTQRVILRPVPVFVETAHRMLASLRGPLSYQKELGERRALYVGIGASNRAWVAGGLAEEEEERRSHVSSQSHLLSTRDALERFHTLSARVRYTGNSVTKHNRRTSAISAKSRRLAVMSVAPTRRQLAAIRMSCRKLAHFSFAS